MKKTKLLFAVLFAVISLVSCKLSTEDLTKEVKKSMTESKQFKENSIKINSLILTKKSGNEYDGVLQTTEPNGEFTYKVAVVYDGNNMTWEIKE